MLEIKSYVSTNTSNHVRSNVSCAAYDDNTQTIQSFDFYLDPLNYLHYVGCQANTYSFVNFSNKVSNNHLLPISTLGLFYK